ncbi:MAG: FGGY family carbohydrate kinase [Chloroflexota bacterium]
MSVVALDIGTSRLKAIVARWDGTTLATGSVPTPAVADAPGRLELPADAVADAAAGLVAGLLAGSSADPADTLVLSCLGTAMAPFDRDERPLAPALSPADLRPGAVPGLLAATGIDPAILFPLTGQDPRLTSFLHHWLWWRATDPDRLRGLHRFRSLRGTIVARLTGADAEDPTWASRTMCMDLETDRWSSTILDAAGLDASRLPGIHPPTSAWPVLPGAAAAFGLPPGARVVLGAMDNCAAFLGAVAPGEERLVNIAGTFEHLAGVGPLPVVRAAAGAVGGLIHRWVLPGTYLSYSRVPIGVLLGAIGSAAPEGIGPLLAAADPVPVGRRIALDEPSVRAALAAGTAQADVLQAVLESGAAVLADYAAGWIGGGGAIDRIVIVGGGAAQPATLRLKAAVLGRPVATLASDEAGSIGALRLAAIAVRGASLADACALFPDPVAVTWSAAGPAA